VSPPPDGEPGTAEVRALLESESVGLLSTTSVHRPGYPYGSLTPFALSARGTPLLLLSGLAAHTKNLLADPRACLFGRAVHVDEPDARARYLARHPKAAAYFQLRDFAMWELIVEEARLISGFGTMRWIPFSPGT
jgi:hypothetical protein